jgi:GNAT superfamily N-acetyltransferase
MRRNERPGPVGTSALLSDGTVVELRPVDANDKPLLVEGMARLSPTSRRMRFMSATDQLSPAQLAYLTEIDHHSHLAWGVLIDGAPVALGRLIRLPDRPEVAELGLTVVDQWQRRGIGYLLLTVLAEVGRSLGIRRIVFEALAENKAIIGLVDRFGATHHTSEGVVSGELDAAAVPSPARVEGDLVALAQTVRDLYAGQAETGFTPRPAAGAVPRTRPEPG